MLMTKMTEMMTMTSQMRGISKLVFPTVISRITVAVYKIIMVSREEVLLWGSTFFHVYKTL